MQQASPPLWGQECLPTSQEADVEVELGDLLQGWGACGRRCCSLHMEVPVSRGRAL